jgi:hypothetical protein
VAAVDQHLEQRLVGGKGMKFTDVLRGHVFPNDAEVTDIWANADFCLDTNVLLDVYRYTDQGGCDTQFRREG